MITLLPHWGDVKMNYPKLTSLYLTYGYLIPYALLLSETIAPYKIQTDLFKVDFIIGYLLLNASVPYLDLVESSAVVDEVDSISYNYLFQLYD